MDESEISNALSVIELLAADAMMRHGSLSRIPLKSGVTGVNSPSGKPADGPIVVIGGEISTTIFGRGERCHAEAQRRGESVRGGREATEYGRQWRASARR